VKEIARSATLGRVSRRRFLERSSLAATAGFLGLRHAAGSETNMAVVDRYGPLVPDPHRIVDLPSGFRYRVLSRTGDSMVDGLVVPGFPDGMGAFAAADGRVVLIRNHELESKGEPGEADFFRRLGPFGRKNELFADVDASRLYDRGANGSYPSIGGTTTLVFDPQTGAVTTEFMSLAGTERNCAGGVTPWGTWITCEESSEKANGEFLDDHGYAFEVKPSLTPELQTAVPYREMGRFRREAVAVDPRTGIVFQTEDMGDGLFYRFTPNVPSELRRGGRLQALAIAGRAGADTRHWGESERVIELGQKLAVEWVDMDDEEAPNNDLRHRGLADGAALFARGEGIWFGDGVCYFACTSGGAKKLGQIFKYVPAGDAGDASGGTLELFIESTDGNIMQSADNLTIAPWGDLLVCEDRGENSHIRGVTANGRIYDIARNAVNGTEFAGACFAPQMTTLFVNLQKPGITLAIDGPWSPTG